MSLPWTRVADEGPVRPTKLPLRAAWADEIELHEVNSVLTSGALGPGPRTEEFERAFAALVEVRHAVAVNSCWAGFHLAFEAVGLGPGDEVITSAAVPATTAAALHHLGVRPVLVDIEPGTLNLDPEDVGRKITDRTRAIVPVHFGGYPVAMDSVLRLAARHRLAVIEDALHALPARYRGRMIGAIGDVTVFGLSTDRNITTGEGGMLTTESSELACLFRSRRSYGMSDGTRCRRPAGGREYTQARMHGYGYAMTDLTAAVGLGQLRKVHMFHGIRSYYATLYQFGLSDLGELVLPEVPPDIQHGWGLYVVQLKTDRLTVDRDAAIHLLARENVQAGIDFVPLHAHAFYREAFALQPHDYPRAVEAYERSLSLPLYPRMSEGDVWDVVRAVRKVLTRHARQAPS